MERILTIAGSFSEEWASQLRVDSQGEVKDAVDSVVANRNRISHGDDVGITYARVQEYYTQIIKLIELVENQCSQ